MINLRSIFFFFLRRHGVRDFLQKVGRRIYRESYNCSYDFLRNGEVYTVKEFLTEEPVVVDVGANSGDWAESFLRSFPRARMFLIEPNPLLRDSIKERFSGRSNVQVLGCALSSKDGVGILNIPVGKSTHSSLLDIHVGRSSCNVEQVKVEIRSGDHLIKEIGLACVDFLKIDTEGLDLEVLKGFSNAIAAGAIKVIQFEYSEINLEKRIYLEDFYLNLQDYKIGRIYPTDIDFKSYNLRDENFVPGNFTAVHRSLE